MPNKKYRVSGAIRYPNWDPDAALDGWFRDESFEAENDDAAKQKANSLISEWFKRFDIMEGKGNIEKLYFTLVEVTEVEGWNWSKDSGKPMPKFKPMTKAKSAKS